MIVLTAVSGLVARGVVPLISPALDVPVTSAADSVVAGEESTWGPRVSQVKISESHAAVRRFPGTPAHALAQAPRLPVVSSGKVL